MDRAVHVCLVEGASAMGRKEFAEAVQDERNALLMSFANPKGETAVAAHLLAARLSTSQREEVMAAINAALTDALYTILVALDGSASLGGTQQTYLLQGETGDIIANGDGRLEAAAWNTLYGDGS